ncbi:winged helix-turn-helix domain-containing protein [Photobacterium sp. OFAV2-7]|uniref:winged helix-turn-helix domain-containing protein n=1 Tax=Photobacterium sp. OFAV2-7 TaxID=2917748 RepID=UPI001EF41E31|nr:winged helix-turn-helix domain-containing protein [Photobacterium sp. OFAV2-7]MCG7584337.1 winged helix-turn-helix domain-containing protein [Photobacterium sp. OFAV2-7]
MMERKYNIDNQFVFAPKNNTLFKIDNNEEVTILGTNETRLLCYLLENSHRTIKRKELISIIWNNRDIYVDDSSLTQSVSTLRKVLGDSTKSPAFIKTIPKLGYEFIAPTKNLSEPKVEHDKHKLEQETLAAHNNVHDVRGVISPQYLVFHTFLLKFEVLTIALILLYFWFF